MKRILLSIAAVLFVASAAAAATIAQFSDTETSTGNSLAAGTLDLSVDGNNGVNTQKFSVTNMKPGDSQAGTYTLNNSGSIAGYLDLESISVTSNENTCLEPEVASGDTSCTDPNAGELAGLLNLDIFFDANNNGVKDGAEVSIYNGKANLIPSNFDLDQLIAAGGTNYLTVVASWPDQANDNQGMSDDMTLNMTFELLQNAD